MIGTIMLALGIILIALGFFFTMSGSRKLSDVSVGEGHQYHQYDSSSGNGLGTDHSGHGFTDQSNRSTVKGGGVIMIGPIPIIFGSDRKSSEIAIILAIILMLLWFVLFH